jgi:gamma-glutamyl-gamma-aminobutyrate hydrolase PuuD
LTRVALTMRVTEAAGYDEARDSISHDWLRRLGEWGMTPLLVPNVGDAASAYLDGLSPDVLVLTGGDDLGAMPERDATETRLLDHAFAAGLPVFGVCRGLQLINAHFKGRLVAVDGHAGEPHSISVTPPWQPIYGSTTTVNSYHDQGVPTDGVAGELMATATDEHGNVEGLCHPEKPLAAVMWHPERSGGLEGDRLLLACLAEGDLPWL